jgi:hypothetical protein
VASWLEARSVLIGERIVHSDEATGTP